MATPWDKEIERLKDHKFRSSGETRILGTLETQAKAYFQGVTDTQETHQELVDACRWALAHGLDGLVGSIAINAALTKLAVFSD